MFDAATAALISSATLALLSPAEPSPGERYVEQFQGAVADGGMQRWMESMTPSLGHEVIAQFAGDWSYDVAISPGPGAPPMKAQWTGAAQMTMGGRFLEMHAKGPMMGMPFEGLYMVGYDNSRHLFTLTSFSTTGTGVQYLSGNLDQTGKVLTFVGEMDEPMTGEMGKSFMITWTLDSPDQWTQRVYEILYGEPFVVIESVATRAE